MRIGVIVDGVSELNSLSELFGELHEATHNTLIGPILADVQPKAPFGAIARSCLSRVSLLERKRAERVLILVDREDRPECPGLMAQSIETYLNSMSATPVCVVIKDKMYENWLVADVEALRSQRGRFLLSKADQNRIVPNMADHADATAIISRSTIGGGYNKVKDSKAIMREARVAAIGENSRSFRRFLRCVGYPDYARQSLRPLSAIRVHRPVTRTRTRR